MERDEAIIVNLMLIFGMPRGRAEAIVSAVNRDMGQPRK
jgi:hypothetical protein